jgi:hypothetical protein
MSILRQRFPGFDAKTPSTFATLAQDVQERWKENPQQEEQENASKDA